MTRLLETPQCSTGPGLEPATPPAEAPDRHSSHAALESAVLRGFVYGVSGLVWLGVMALFIHHFGR
ncbi:hypothetical protein MMSR116_27530 [Methylobacterium mesophilicum SR1.6/6]|uniref:Uncharacterized protein n=1 Tax=Methylobacterium mesophilicum SR1.6/6 TaxID=908290 RepID=A0A6B9FRL1_9HYPH|nr:hypothetical protein [Methylobacterium mesophilicum]QGY05231.1 hypothetical protein MMSR116_27530 [Methylobacterium mesophilicum SR1.6/6]